MEELLRLKKIIDDQYDGNPWLDVTIVGTLNKLSASDAAKKVDDLNSIWQIVNHLIEWREVLWKKLDGEKVVVTITNFIDEVNDTSEKAWKQTLKRFEKSQKNVLNFLSKLKEFDHDKTYPNGHTAYEHLLAIIQHDAYHLGQIVIINKLVSKK